jgi:hypothetical protein
MVTWFFENNQFANAWIPFDRSNQKKLEYVYKHHEQLIQHMQQDSSSSLQHHDCTRIKDIDLDEEDASIHQFIQYDYNCLYIQLIDSHFEQEITLYPAMLLGSLPDRDILIVRAEMMDHSNKNKHLDV